MRIFLITLLLMFGTQAVADMIFSIHPEKSFFGSEAVELVLNAQKKGFILQNRIFYEQYGKINVDKPVSVNFIKLLLDGRYYECRLEIRNQACDDLTGIGGIYERESH